MVRLPAAIVACLNHFAPLFSRRIQQSFINDGSLAATRQPQPPLRFDAIPYEFRWIWVVDDGGTRILKHSGRRMVEDVDGRAKSSFYIAHLTLTTVPTTALPHIDGPQRMERYAKPDKFRLGVRPWTSGDRWFGVRLSPISTR